ncbi:hypothetical protein [Bythopirellula polymerisocia]|uniref:Uncharacterized protein n=1 Tax=Bythopirellula polymerisocia TaxID=2528003 RepID=A0A5C6CBH0_9BACT|nr:hypothetical protein [Bythopirellula polymerisocia]TWU20764.1 hypothetical protein Pla144_48150 [Bythopirellula polymerisocia]
MDYAAIKSFFLKVFLGFLGLTAVVAIISVLSGEFGELQEKILATCFTVSAASICSMSCAAFIEKKRRVQLGLTGIGLSIASAILVIIGLWTEIDSDAYWKTTVTFTVAAISFAYAFLLTLDQLEERHKWVQRVFCMCVGVLALQIVVAIWGEIEAEGYFRALAVVAIVVGLQTLAIAIVAKLQKSHRGQSEKLVLEKLADDIYRDAAGKHYQLHEIHSEEDDEGNE